MTARRTDPTKSLLDRSFAYTNAANTDLRAKFAEIRAQQAKPEPMNVKPIRRSK